MSDHIIHVSQDAYDWLMRPETDDEVPHALRALVLEQRRKEARCD